MLFALLLFTVLAGAKTDALVTHGLAAGAGYLVGKAGSSTQSASETVEYTSSQNACRCEPTTARGGCYYDYTFTPVSERAYLILACGAPRTVTITRRTWTEKYLYLEWRP